MEEPTGLVARHTYGGLRRRRRRDKPRVKGVTTITTEVESKIREGRIIGVTMRPSKVDFTKDFDGGGREWEAGDIGREEEEERGVGHERLIL
jgi:hypothetical protein